MAKQDDWISIIALGLAIIAMVIVVAKSNGQNVVLQQDARNAITVSGESELMVAPDKAEIYVRVETRDDEAVEAQAENRRISDKVMAALKDKGPDDEDFETVQYRLERVERWNPDLRKNVFEGYSLYHVMRVTTTELEKTGTLIDAAVEAGANSIDSVSFGLSEDLMAESRDQALKEAAGQAEKKARALAGSLDVGLGKPLRISESSFDFVPFVARDFAMKAEAAAPPTQISPENVKVSATVSVDYEIR